MSDGTRENGNRDKAHTDEAALSARLQRLGEGLGSARGRAAPPCEGPGGDRATTASGYARGFRLSSELVGGVLVGAGIGWLIDRLLGISPWGFIVFLLLGFVAGVLNVMRSAGSFPAARWMTAGLRTLPCVRGRAERTTKSDGLRLVRQTTMEP